MRVTISRLNADVSLTHADEVAIPESLVRALLREQFPQWADLRLERVASYGTDNVLFRLGDELYVRLPRLRTATTPRWAIEQIDKEAEWLPRLAPHLPVEIPEVVARGEPGAEYPWRWGVYRWLEGEPPRTGTVQIAHDLAAFIAALQRIDTTGAPPGGHRGGPLSVRDRDTRAALAQLEQEIDVSAAAAVWDAALHAPTWDRAPVWLHGDILEGNLLLRGDRLGAVIDWGAACAGDPAFDYSIAWSLLAPVRDEFRRASQIDDETWARARGLALSQAVIALPYYLHSNPPIVERSRTVVAQVLSDGRSS